jgi:hypothetical protein
MMPRRFMIATAVSVLVLATSPAAARLAFLSLDRDDWERLSEGQQAAYLSGAVTVWFIHGLRCPDRGSAPLIDWRWLRQAVTQDLATLPKADAEVNRSLIRIFSREGCEGILPPR